jgi:tRNA dimethylallyltransferase
MPTDRQRIVRALEVLESTGRPLAHWQRQPGKPVLAEAETVRLLVLPDRDGHGAGIDARFEAMLAAGALEEVGALLALGLVRDLPVMRALGVGPLAAHIEGRIGRQEAVAAAKSETRRYAKRQRTWLRRNMIAWRVIKTNEIDRFVAGDLSFIDI